MSEVDDTTPSGVGDDGAPKRKPGRPVGSKTRKPPPTGVGAVPEHPWTETDPESLVAEVLERLAEYNREPGELQVRVERIDGGDRVVVGEPFEFDRVTHSESKTPGDVCRTIIQEEYHLPSGINVSALYHAKIVWKQTGRIFAGPRFRLPSQYQIHAMKRAAYERQQREAREGAGDMPPPPPRVRHEEIPPRDTGMGWAPNGGGGRDAEREAEQRELAYLRGTLEEVIRANREGRQANIPPPPTGDVSEDRIVSRVVEALRGTGFGAAPPQAQAQQPAAPPPPPPAPADPMTSALQEMVGDIRGAVLREARDRVKNALSGGHGAGSAPAEATAEVVAEPAEKDDGMDVTFQQIPEAKWSNGSQVQMAVKKENGDIDWLKTAFANPAIAEKALEFGNALVETLAKTVGIKGAVPGAPGAAEVVSNIPRSAVDGNPGGGGWQGG